MDGQGPGGGEGKETCGRSWGGKARSSATMRTRTFCTTIYNDSIRTSQRTLYVHYDDQQVNAVYGKNSASAAFTRADTSIPATERLGRTLVALPSQTGPESL